MDFNLEGGNVMASNNKGAVLCFTGNGKGKSTAAFGIALRAYGHGQNVCIIQFIKSSDIVIGERETFKQLGIEMHQMGKGFTNKNEIKAHKEGIREAWALAKEKIMSNAYDVVILDEINNVFGIKRFDHREVLTADMCMDCFKDRPERTNIVLTGRSAPDALREYADLVTVCHEEKHYYQAGRQAIKGIDY